MSTSFSNQILGGGGFVDCPCIDSTVYTTAIQNCNFSVVEEGGVSSTQPGFWIYGPNNYQTTTTDSSSGSDSNVNVPFPGGSCYPINFGSHSCQAHDFGVDPLCSSVADGERPLYCQNQWCYVDPTKCKDSDHLYYKSTFLGLRQQEVYYSYSTCNSSNTDWDNFNTFNKLANVDVTITIPGLWEPGHYKDIDEDNLTEEHLYLDDSIPWKGWVIDYLEAVLQLSNIGSFNYTYRSQGTKVISPSAYTASMGDIKAGISDVVASSLWITSERLAMTPFTTQTSSDKIYLWVPTPTITSSGYGQKVLQPFDPTLWLCFSLAILLTSMLSIWFATPISTHRKWCKEVHSPKWKNATFRSRLYKRFRITFDAFIAYSMFFFGHTCNYDIKASYPAKILNFGFGFLILIAVSAYTANLAAFLTLQGVSNYISSMEAAVRQTVVLCAPIALKQDLIQIWPKAIFEFYASSTDDMFDKYDTGICGALVGSYFDMRQSKSIIDGLCAREIIRTDSIAMEIPLGFAASPDHVAGLSFWMEEAEKEGITFESFAAEYQPELSCSLDVPEVEVDPLASLTPANFVLPFCVLLVCAGVAVGLHLYQKHLDRLASRKAKVEEEAIMLKRTAGSEEHGLEFELDTIQEGAQFVGNKTASQTAGSCVVGGRFDYSMGMSMNESALFDESCRSLGGGGADLSSSQQRTIETKIPSNLLDIAANNDEMATLLDMMKDVADSNGRLQQMVTDMQTNQERFYTMQQQQQQQHQQQG